MIMKKIDQKVKDSLKSEGFDLEKAIREAFFRMPVRLDDLDEKLNGTLRYYWLCGAKYGHQRCFEKAEKFYLCLDRIKWLLADKGLDLGSEYRDLCEVLEEWKGIRKI